MRYKEYKKVAIPWLDEVPSHWEIVRGKSYIETKKTLNKSKIINNVLSLTLKGVIRNNKENPIGLSPSDYSTYQIFRKNNLVFKLIDLNNISTSRVGLVNETGIMSSAYIRGIINELLIYPKYIFYWYFGLYVKEVFNKLGNGVRATLTAKELFNLEIPLPPKEEQEQIARFLDWKTNEIDRMIYKKKKRKRYINKLKKTYVSDIINKICEEDDLTRLNLKKILKPKTIRKIDIQEEMKLLSVVREKGVIIRDLSQDSTNHNPIPEDLSDYKVVRKNDFVMNKMKAWQGSYGISRYDGVVSPAYYVFELLLSENILLLDYFNLSIRTQIYIDEFSKNSKGIRTGQWDFPVDKLGDIDFILPSIENQKKILWIIERIKQNLNSLEINIYTQIKRLELLKQSLISDVVTGRIDVRGIAIPAYEKIEDVSDGEILDEDFAEGMEEV